MHTHKLINYGKTLAVVESGCRVSTCSERVFFVRPPARLELFIMWRGSVTLPGGERWVNRKRSAKTAGSAEMVKVVHTIQG